MIDLIIKDINCALDNKAYFAALCLALTLPDICGKAEFPNETNTKKRYIGWHDEYIGKFEKRPKMDDNHPEMPYLSVEVVFSLRNFLLHQGTPNIDINRIQEEACKIDNFELLVEEKNEFDIYADSSAYCHNSGKRTYRVSIRRLCCILCWVAEPYYQENKEKFNFFNCSIVEYNNGIRN